MDAATGNKRRPTVDSQADQRHEPVHPCKTELNRAAHKSHRSDFRVDPFRYSRPMKRRKSVKTRLSTEETRITSN